MADAAIVMAGGSGTRLWPASLTEFPKQLLRIGGRHSLFQQAMLRASAVCSDGPIAVVTNRSHVDQLAAHLAELATEAPSLLARVTIIPEPAGRNTAPAIAVGMAFLQGALNAGGAVGEHTVVVLSADHIIAPTERFAADARVATQAAADHRLVCFGIRPTHPETGFGYIQTGAEIPCGGAECYEVDRFKEKPDRSTAESYLAAGTYLWNAGMFCFQIDHFRRELERRQPAIAASVWDAADAGAFDDPASVRGAACTSADGLAAAYDVLPSISVDNALLEQSDRVAVVPATFTWSDVGSWDAVAGLSASAPAGDEGADAAPVIRIDAGGTFVRSEIPIALCGVDDLLVVIENGRALVCRAGASQLVKRAVDQISERGLTELL